MFAISECPDSDGFACAFSERDVDQTSKKLHTEMFWLLQVSVKVTKMFTGNMVFHQVTLLLILSP